ncbi:MAG: HlyC/CorC family transporter [Spirochaetales bacterium]|nr:HlyC/CorC family transporter [Spirochaetales bacterium]
MMRVVLPGAGESAGPDDADDSDEANTERREMIRGIEELSETTVKEVMVPRIDTVFIPLDAQRDELLATVIECGHSRIPVYRETIDDVVGVLYVKDLLLAIAKGEQIDLSTLIRKPFFVPESKRIDTLLREFKRRHVHIAIAIDEYGGVSGIVCMEDIIEEIVGDIQDEFDDEREDIVALGDAAWLCDARVNLEDLNEEIGVNLPTEGFDTLGGFVFDLFGKIPARYEKVSWQLFDFVIQEMDGHRIGAVKILRRPEAPEEP